MYLIGFLPLLYPTEYPSYGQTYGIHVQGLDATKRELKILRLASVRKNNKKSIYFFRYKTTT